MYDWPAVDHEQLHRARAERIGALMRAERLDHLLLTSFDNIRYVTGYRTQIISKGFDWFAAVARVRAENLVQVMRPGGIR